MSLLNELHPVVPFEQYDFGSPELSPQSPEELHTYMANMFTANFRSPATPVPALHVGTLVWEDIQNGTYEDFQRHHAGLGVPASDGDRPETLHVLWQSL